VQYVEMVEAMSEDYTKNIHRVGDESAFMPGGFQVAALAAGGAITATEAVLEGSVKNAYVLCRCDRLVIFTYSRLICAQLTLGACMHLLTAAGTDVSVIGCYTEHRPFIVVANCIACWFHYCSAGAAARADSELPQIPHGHRPDGCPALLSCSTLR
jgi:hypothetical protein